MPKINYKEGEKYQGDLAHIFRGRLRLIARIALSISLLSTVLLLATLYFLFRGQKEDSYWLVIQSLTLSRDQLMIAMLIGGALILLVAGLITWFITLYSSARIAGPLYRFSKNIELEIKQGPVATINLRKGDYFQELSLQMACAAERLNTNYKRQLALVDEFDHYLESSDVVDAGEFRRLLDQLKTTEVKL